MRKEHIANLEIYLQPMHCNLIVIESPALRNAHHPLPTHIFLSHACNFLSRNHSLTYRLHEHRRIPPVVAVLLSVAAPSSHEEELKCNNRVKKLAIDSEFLSVRDPTIGIPIFIIQYVTLSTGGIQLYY